MERNLAMARRIARMAEKAGGRVYFVGGFVRDSVMGRESKDVDIEIHGMTADAVRKMLGEIGPWKEMGASFGVFALRGYGKAYLQGAREAFRALPRLQKPKFRLRNLPYYVLLQFWLIGNFFKYAVYRTRRALGRK